MPCKQGKDMEASCDMLIKRVGGPKRGWLEYAMSGGVYHRAHQLQSDWAVCQWKDQSRQHSRQTADCMPG